jgi:NADH:ubiquinone oxidoreductase subunit C
MSIEENIKQALNKKFGFPEDAVRIPRPRRIFLELPVADFEKVFVFAKDELKFGHLVSITGFDEPEKLAFMYHCAQDNGIMLNIKISVDKSRPVIKSVTPYFLGADIYERELVDLFGAKVEGLTTGNRYPLTDDWPAGEYPLRKDWKASEPKGRAA